MSELRASQVQALGDVIDFGIGQPGFDLLPAGLLQQAGQARLDGRDTSFLNYGMEQGDGFFRRALAAFLSDEYRLPVDPRELFVTTGASTALSLICTLFTQPGDVIFVEEPSYFLALRIFEDHGLRVIGIPMDDDGLDLVALQAALERHRPALLYTIPTFQNPTGITLNAARRRQLAELAATHQFLVVADEVYHGLSYTATPPPPLAAHTAGGRVISVGSFSKILAPGLRLGWIQGAPELVARLAGCGLVDSGGGLNPLAAALVRPLLEGGEQRNYLRELCNVYGARVRTLDAALRREAGEFASFAQPDGGFFFWLRLADQVDTEALLGAAREHKVGFQPGVRFSSYGGLKNYLRLSFAFYGMPDLERGARRLGRTLRGD